MIAPRLACLGALRKYDSAWRLEPGGAIIIAICKPRAEIMIWNSVPLMTAIDLVIIAVTLYVIWRCRPFIRGRRSSASRIGVWLVASGLLVVCLFYAADLISMHAL